MRVFLSAGEASGEHYGAQLIARLRELRPAAEFFGLGGERMRQAGCGVIVDASEVSVLGLAEVVRHLPGIWRRFRRLLAEVDRQRPDVAVLIDFPDFNLRLARALYRRGIPVVYLVSPQLWAWRQGRIKLVQKYVSKMLVIFPFEEKFYRERGVQVEYVGHPLAEEKMSLATREEYAARYGLDAARPWIALLPGSRRREILLNLPELLAIPALLRDYQYVLPLASTIEERWLEAQISMMPSRRDNPAPLVLTRDARSALAHARASVVASGTATVEAALIGNPFVVVYRVTPLTWKLGRWLVKLDRFAMPNLIAGDDVVPELMQQDFTAQNVVRALAPLLQEGPERTRQVAGLRRVRELLASPAGSTGANSAMGRAAAAVLAAVK